MIAEQSDAFRAAACGLTNTGGAPEGRLVVTHGIDAEGPDFVLEAVRKVGAFSEFTMDNDPYGWHEMGSIEVRAKTVWWKIDLYDANYTFGSDTPHDVSKTRRVLTLLFPSEY